MRESLLSCLWFQVLISGELRERGWGERDRATNRHRQRKTETESETEVGEVKREGNDGEIEE